MTGWNDEIRDPATPLAPWKIQAARAALWAERLTDAFWKPVALILAYAGIGLLNTPSFLGATAAGAAAMAFYAALAFLSLQGLRRFKAPLPEEILRRLEDANRLPHRPLSALQDKAVTGVLKLWNLEQDRRRQIAATVQPFPPGPILARRDPHGLRYLALLLFIVGLAVAGAQTPQRLSQSFFPSNPLKTATGKTADDASIVLWIEPPAYTGVEKTVIRGAGAIEAPLRIPQGSLFKIRVNGGWGQPEARMGGYRFKLSPMSGKSWGASLMAIPGDELTLRRLFITRLRVPYAYITDTPPVISLTHAPEPLLHGRMRFKIPVSDDYGIRDLTVSITAAEQADAMPEIGAPVQETRPLMTAGSPKTIEIEPVYDLSAHPWAGLPVHVAFTATDALGQSARSETLRIVLPEREFRHPIAKGIVALRRKLLWTPLAARQEVAGHLETILERPGLYGGDPVVFLALRAAASRLAYNRDKPSVASVVPLLWDIALGIEDGNLSLAARDLRAAREALEQALRDPATTPEKLAALNDRLREAMANYLRELGREMQKRMADGETFPLVPPDDTGRVLDERLLSGLLDKLQSESLSGNRDKAMEMLSMLEKMTDLMDPSMAAPLPPDLKFMSQGISELQKLTQRQEELLEQTREQAQTKEEQHGFSYPKPAAPEENAQTPRMGEMPPAPSPEADPSPPLDTGKNKGEQDALRLILGELMREAGEKLKDVPESLGKAEMAMRKSAKELGENRPDLSIPHQEEALRHLKDGAQQMNRQMVARLEKMTGLSFSQGQTDPLGRPYEGQDKPGGQKPDNSVKLPSEAERRRIDEILKTLRQRSGEYERPQEEIDYLRRLLRQF